MNNFDLTVDGEVFHVSEEVEDGGGASYYFAWLNGPANGSYGWTVRHFSIGSESTDDGLMARMTREQLGAEIKAFIEAFYAPGGIGEEDFPGHRPAKPRI